MKQEIWFCDKCQKEFSHPANLILIKIPSPVFFNIQDEVEEFKICKSCLGKLRTILKKYYF